MTRKAVLMELENKGGDLCKDHARILHQIEHIQWHLEGCAKHKPCHSHPFENVCSKKTIDSTSCQSSANTSICRPSHMVNITIKTNYKRKLNFFLFFRQIYEIVQNV